MLLNNHLVGFGSGASGGPDAFTKLQLSMDGTDTATSFPDDTGNHTVTANGNAQVDTAQQKFGTGSCVFDGTGDYLSVPDSVDFEQTSTPWTVELWARLNATTGRYTFCDKSNSGNTGWAIWMLDGALAWYVLSSGSATVTCIQPSATGWSTATWYHIAVDYDGTDYRIYRDGVVLQTTTSATVPGANTYPFQIGRGGFNGDSGDYNGWIDELRFSNGVARYAGAFTPPAVPFP